MTESLVERIAPLVLQDTDGNDVVLSSAWTESDRAAAVVFIRHFG